MWNGSNANKFQEMYFDPITHDIRSCCLLFEFRGILWMHCLLVLGHEGVTIVQAKYVLKM